MWTTPVTSVDLLCPAAPPGAPGGGDARCARRRTGNRWPDAARTRKRDDPRRGETGVVGRFGSGGVEPNHSAVTGGATAEGLSVVRDMNTRRAGKSA
ncbi:hypothetical protein C1I99_07705 [Micromonospora deserti]|uniref:Uncharacterized protein n=1 Tax=Micromonospora deserti TaxID=2070366 RepID=A0A2W2E8S3_9ACTN|nr:hypothetical protein C1I99_07705 [Micromonospora deserti]